MKHKHTATWTAREAARGASYSDTFATYTHQVKGAPRHLGAAADDAADFKQRLGDCFSESKAAATRLATERDQRQGVRARVHVRRARFVCFYLYVAVYHYMLSGGGMFATPPPRSKLACLRRAGTLFRLLLPRSTRTLTTPCFLPHLRYLHPQLEMRQLKRALQELKEVDFSESGDVLAKVSVRAGAGGTLTSQSFGFPSPQQLCWFVVPPRRPPPSPSRRDAHTHTCFLARP